MASCLRRLSRIGRHLQIHMTRFNSGPGPHPSVRRGEAQRMVQVTTTSPEALRWKGGCLGQCSSHAGRDVSGVPGPGELAEGGGESPLRCRRNRYAILRDPCEDSREGAGNRRPGDGLSRRWNTAKSNRSERRRLQVDREQCRWGHVGKRPCSRPDQFPVSLRRCCSSKDNVTRHSDAGIRPRS